LTTKQAYFKVHTSLDATPTPVPHISTPTPAPTASPVSSHVGLYQGFALLANENYADTVDIQINSNGAGIFSVQFPNLNEIWNGSLTNISGANVTGAGEFTLSGVWLGCDFTLDATFVSPTEISGRYSILGTNCPQTGTQQFTASLT
jgi:hypothetical protein